MRVPKPQRHLHVLSLAPSRCVHLSATAALLLTGLRSGARMEYLRLRWRLGCGFVGVVGAAIPGLRQRVQWQEPGLL
jgi:hypothetical protein